MKIFVSWSGELSHQVALLLREWLPNVIQAFEVFVSSEDIQKGTRSLNKLAQELEDSNYGIICLTSLNAEAPWILFEAGVLSHRLGWSRVSPLLIDISPSDVKGPLAQLQATSLNEKEMSKLMDAMNESLGERRLDPSILAKSFAMWWPDLEGKFQEAISKIDESKEPKASRSERDLLEEILQLARSGQDLLEKNFQLSQTIVRSDLEERELAHRQQPGVRFARIPASEQPNEEDES